MISEFAQPVGAFLSFSLSFSIRCQRRMAAESIIRKGLLERVSCDLHSYILLLYFVSSLASFSERKRIPSDYTSSSGNYVHIFFRICNICTCTHKSTRTTDSIIGCGDNPCYRNVSPARKLKCRVFLLRAWPTHCEIINDNVVIISRGKEIEMLVERPIVRSIDRPPARNVAGGLRENSRTNLLLGPPGA